MVLSEFFLRAAHAISILNRIVLFLCRYATIFLLTAIVIVTAAGVFWRYVLNDALSWSEEVGKYLMVWMTFTGAPIALKHGQHVGIEILPHAVSPRIRQFILSFIYIIIIFVLVFLFYFACRLTWNAAPQIAETFDMSLAFVYAALPIGIAFMFTVALEFLFRTIAGWWDPEKGFGNFTETMDVQANKVVD